MRKFLLSALVCGLVAMSASGSNPCKMAVERPAALSGTLAVDYTLLEDGGIWSHVYTIEAFDAATGKFAGTGHYIPDPSYTEIITGAVTGNFVVFHILYTGTNANYQVDAMGTLDENGRLSGTAISVGQSFTWVGTPVPR